MCLEPGFTLIELIVTIAVMIILVSIALPSFMGFIQANRLTAQTNDLVTVLNYARSEAIKRGVRVTLCSSNNGTSCLGSTTWDTGWIAFIDTNGDGLVGGEQIMQVRGALEADNALRSNIQHLTYRNDGIPDQQAVGGDYQFSLCDGVNAVRPIRVNPMGRVAVNPPTTVACP